MHDIFDEAEIVGLEGTAQRRRMSRIHDGPPVDHQVGVADARARLLDRPNRGSVTVDGIDLAGLKDKALARFRNAHIGFVFQFHQLLPEFNALENAMLPALVGGKSEKEAEASAMAKLTELGLAARAKHLPSQLSGGEQQRVAVARALVNDPPLLFADEPSGNLDTANAEALHDLFFDLRDRHGLTIALVTHNEGLAERADRQIRLRDGRIQS